MTIDISFSCYLISALTLIIIVLIKYWLIFEVCHQFYFISFNFERSGSKNKQKNISCGI